MPQFGQVYRTNPRVTVLRGYDPNEPTTLTQHAPVQEGITIESGQVISLSWNAVKGVDEWVLGCAPGVLPYIALQDYNEMIGSTGIGRDEDVIEAGKLTGLSCAGDFEIETAHFDSEGTYNVDTPLTFDGVTGDVTVGTLGVDTILGFVTRNHGVKNLDRINSGVDNKDVISFQTNLTVVGA